MTPERDGPDSNGVGGTTLFDSGLEPEPTTNVVKIRAGATVKKVEMALFVDNLFNAHPQLDLNHQDDQTLLYEASYPASAHLRTHRDVSLLSGMGTELKAGSLSFIESMVMGVAGSAPGYTICGERRRR